MAPGIFLSQPPMQRTASMLAPRQTVSMESAITSRLIREHFMPSVPMEMPSLIVMVPNICGMPPPFRSSTEAISASLPRPALQGVISLCPFAIPMMGFSKSSSVNPTALSIARLGARRSPWVIDRLLVLRGVIFISFWFTC